MAVATAPVSSAGVSSPPLRFAVNVCAAAGAVQIATIAAATAHALRNRFMGDSLLVRGETGAERGEQKADQPPAGQINDLAVLIEAAAYHPRNPLSRHGGSK